MEGNQWANGSGAEQGLPAPSGPVPGWYADPYRQAPLRYWDGHSWTGYLSGDVAQISGPTSAAVGAPVERPTKRRAVPFTLASIAAVGVLAAGAVYVSRVRESAAPTSGTISVGNNSEGQPSGAGGETADTPSASSASLFDRYQTPGSFAAALADPGFVAYAASSKASFSDLMEDPSQLDAYIYGLTSRLQADPCSIFLPEQIQDAFGWPIPLVPAHTIVHLYGYSCAYSEQFGLIPVIVTVTVMSPFVDQSETVRTGFTKLDPSTWEATGEAGIGRSFSDWEDMMSYPDEHLYSYFRANDGIVVSIECGPAYFAEGITPSTCDAGLQRLLPSLAGA